MGQYFVRMLKPHELPMLTALFQYNDPTEMIKENTHRIENGIMDIFALFSGNQLVGELRATYESKDRLEAERNKRAYLSAYRIHEDCRNHGLGKLLLRRVLNCLTEKGYTEFTIGVENDNAIAKHIYRHFGFTEKIARKKDTYQGDRFEYDLLLKRNTPILTDEDGNLFLSFERCPEKSIENQYQPFTHCLSIIKLNDQFLFGYNKWRNRYEIFGGCIESGETPRSCIKRECYEELGISDAEFIFLGVMKFLMRPDYFSDKVRIEYGALYTASIYGRSLRELNKQIHDRKEIMNLAFYNDIKGNFPIAAIDEKLLEYEGNRQK